MIDVIDADEERLDRIARRLFGSEGGGALERLLKANPGLAAGGPFAQRGTRLTVPPRPAVQPNPAYQRPWD